MKIFYFLLMFIGLFIFLHFQTEAAMHHLSEKGKKHKISIFFNYNFSSSDNFTPEGKENLSLSWKVGMPIAVFGLILGVILSILF